MAEAPATQDWIGRLVFIVFAIILIFGQLLPLDTRPDVWAAPNWLLAITLAWVARRPDYVPVFVVALIFLLADLLFQRPPGLWTALVVILTEMLRARTASIRDLPLLLEWGTVAVGIVAITLVNRVVLMVVMSPQQPLALTLIEMVMTIVFFPIVIVIAQFVFGVARPALGQVDNRGHRI